MFAFEIDFFPNPDKRGDEYGQFDDVLTSFLIDLSKNGNIAFEWHLLEFPTHLQARVLTPHQDALKTENWSVYAHENAAKLEALSHRTPEFRFVTEAIRESEYCECAEPSCFVLFTTFLEEDSPVECGDCRRKRALYKLPFLKDEKEHYGLGSWAETYRALDWLYMASGTGERFGYRQLSGERSSFTRQSREIARELERKTGKPFYVFLLHGYEKWGDDCPLCGRNWRLDEAWNRLYSFKCEHSRLVSCEAGLEATPLSKLHP